MTDLNLDAIEARANAASEGPWDALFGGPDLRPRCWWMAYDDPGREGSSFDWQQIQCDAEFVNNARADVPALVAALREARAEVERLRNIGSPFGIDRTLDEFRDHLAADLAGPGVRPYVDEMFSALVARTNEREEARASIAAVRALHVPEWVVIDHVGGSVCRECREPVESEPCATIRALDGAS